MYDAESYIGFLMVHAIELVLAWDATRSRLVHVICTSVFAPNKLLVITFNLLFTIASTPSFCPFLRASRVVSHTSLFLWMATKIVEAQLVSQILMALGTKCTTCSSTREIVVSYKKFISIFEWILTVVHLLVCDIDTASSLDHHLLVELVLDPSSIETCLSRVMRRSRPTS